MRASHWIVSLSIRSTRADESGSPVSAYRAAPFELGRLHRRHASPAPVRPVMIFFLIFGAPGLALISGVQSAKGEVFAGDRAVNVALGAALLAFALSLAVLAFRKSTLSVAVHENGFVWHEKGRTRIVPWTDVVSLRDSHVQRTVAGAEIARTNVYRLRLATGRELVATSMLADVAAFGAHVAQVLERRLPELRDALDKNRSVLFGETALDGEGILHGKRRIPWASITSIGVENGEVVIESRDGAPLTLEWSSLPNARLLLTLVSERVRT
jgi:hypothetical protein